MTVLYFMTFGTFAGFSAQFGLLIKNLFGEFANAPDPFKFAFFGPLVGSAARVISGPIADRLGGGILTFVSGAGIALSAFFTSTQLSPANSDDFMSFFWGMMAIFFFAGVGNASTFKQMPMIFEPRQAGGVMGWTGAIAAFGPFIFGVLLSVMAPAGFFQGVAFFAVVGTAIAWWFYARKGATAKS